MWGSIITGVANLFGGYFKGRQEVKKAKLAAEIAKWEAKAALEHKKIEVEADWDIRALEASKESWKDEFLTIILVAPYVAAFIPPAQPYIQQGFQMIADLPYWWQMSFIGIIAASFGLRWFFNKERLGKIDKMIDGK